MAERRGAAADPTAPSGMMKRDVFQEIRDELAQHVFVLYMLGTREAPADAATTAAVAALAEHRVDVVCVDVASDRSKGEAVKKYSDSALMPQLFCRGLFVAGGEAVADLCASWSPELKTGAPTTSHATGNHYSTLLETLAQDSERFAGVSLPPFASTDEDWTAFRATLREAAAVSSDLVVERLLSTYHHHATDSCEVDWPAFWEVIGAMQRQAKRRLKKGR